MINVVISQIIDCLIAAMADDLRRAVDVVLVKFFRKIESLTPQQFEILKSIFLHGKDTLAMLPSGHGKSLPFQVAPFVASELSGPTYKIAVDRRSSLTINLEYWLDSRR